MYSEWIKPILDRVLALTLLVLLSPFILLLAILVRRKLGAPVFFRQQRPGLHRKPFMLIKFRTMSDERDADGNLLPDAERLPAFGKMLRSTSLDELPELWNVLLGEMSLVGPRPLLMRYLPYYTERESSRFTVRPGITGWAQVNGRNNLGWNERLEADAVYVERMSLWLDLRILWITILKVVRRSDVQVVTNLEMLNLDEERADRV